MLASANLIRRFRDLNSMMFVWCKKKSSTIQESTLKSGLQSWEKFGVESVKVGLLAFDLRKESHPQEYAKLFSQITKTDKDYLEDAAEYRYQTTIDDAKDRNQVAEWRRIFVADAMDKMTKKKLLKQAEPFSKDEYKIVFLLNASFKPESSVLEKSNFLTFNHELNKPAKPIAVLCPWDTLTFQIGDNFLDSDFQKPSNYHVVSGIWTNPAKGQQFVSLYCNYERQTVVVVLKNSNYNQAVVTQVTQGSTKKKTAGQRPNLVSV